MLFEGPDRLAGVTAYGLCFSTSAFDEPAWRMYGFGKNVPIVRIGCRVDALLECARGVALTTDASLFLGNVSYAREKTLWELAQKVADRSHKDVSTTASSLLLQKRRAFCFENEVRFLWMDRAGVQHEKFVPIDPRGVLTVC